MPTAPLAPDEACLVRREAFHGALVKAVIALTMAIAGVAMGTLVSVAYLATREPEPVTIMELEWREEGQCWEDVARRRVLHVAWAD